MNKSKKAMILIVIFGLIMLIIGTTFAYLSWRSSEAQKTVVNFTIGSDFSCAADGGGDITSGTINLIPTEVNDNTTANYIKREVKVMPTITKDGKTIYMDLWLDIKKLDSGLSSSSNLMYVLNTSSTDKDTGVIISGNFGGLAKNNRIKLFTDKDYNSTTTETYYLWIWLDAKETSSDTMNQSFELSLNGSCVDQKEEPNAPELDTGMIPIVFDTSNGTIVKTVSSTDSSWYNYSNQEWANAVLVKENGTQTRAYYKANSGVEINQEDILAYYVWIPRYSYRIPAISCSTIKNPTFESYPTCYSYVLNDSDKTLLINWWYNDEVQYVSDYTIEQATQDVNNMLEGNEVNISGETYTFLNILEWYNDVNDPDITYTTNFNSSNFFKYDANTPREIDILFEDKSADKQNGDAIGTYHTHPAFTFGDTELSGIWVGKFETTGTADNPTILPDVQSLRSQKVSAQFAIAQLLGGSTYGVTTNTDSHMMKNSEWGAAAYLSHSKYGANRETYINNSQSLYTGRSGGNVGGKTPINKTYTAQTSTTQYNSYGYYTWDGYLLNYNTNTKSSTRDLTKVASTTGNITGIYDMSGGADEYVMGYYSAASTTWGATSSSNYAGFSSTPDSKYYDDYTTTNALTACNGGICYGHGLSEVSSWYSDYANFVNANIPWFERGGFSRNGSLAGAFYWGGNYGSANSFYGFRAVLSQIGA